MPQNTSGVGHGSGPIRWVPVRWPTVLWMGNLVEASLPMACWCSCYNALAGWRSYLSTVGWGSEPVERANAWLDFLRHASSNWPEREPRLLVLRVHVWACQVIGWGPSVPVRDLLLDYPWTRGIPILNSKQKTRWQVKNEIVEERKKPFSCFFNKSLHIFILHSVPKLHSQL